ncbi:hypothetical protein DENIS_2793 [Desulfonema ishimotonii]|uniref:Endonuclease GajA/Old nuclease/RecF-like AAA domain-containing protein n=2 Tax=Desulfonema ishimotonii TaxID=45657 RepID=A0A401FXY5_9BACT|nr:hypothetical protein DENIS_2793 [Desulfonema ishimotonii]
MTKIDIDDFTVFIGKNDAGKSTILEALDIFFGNCNPDPDDSSVSDPNKCVKIGCIFKDLPQEIIIDSSNPTSFSKEFLLNKNGFLEIHKLYKCSISKPKCSEAYVIANHPTAPPCADLLQQTITKLKKIAKDVGVDMSTVDQTKKADLRNVIREAVGDLEIRQSSIPLLKKVDGQSLWDCISKYFPVFALFKSDRPSTDQDSEAQDPMKIAIKSAIQQQQEQLQDVTNMINAQVQQVAEKTVEKVREFSEDLANVLTPKVINKNWDTLFNVRLTGDDEIPINKRGSGVRRLILLSFFRAKAEQDAEINNENGIIYAIEEPETSQHPKNQKILIESFLDIVENQGCQILLTTHTPVLVRNIDQKYLRYITSNENGPIVVSCDESNSSEISRNLGVLPDHSVKLFLGVEGRNDINFFKLISKKLHDDDPEIPDLDKAEEDGQLVFIPMGGSSLDLWVSRINGLDRPQFYLMDRDNEPPLEAKYQSQYEKFVREGHTAWITERRELENYINPNIISGAYENYEGRGEPFEDVPLLLAKAIHESSESSNSWEDIVNDSAKLKKKESKAKKILNKNLVSRMTRELLEAHDPDQELIGWLQELGSVLRQ